MSQSRKGLARLSLSVGESFYVFAGTQRQKRVDVEEVTSACNCKLSIDEPNMTKVYNVHGTDAIEILPEVVVKGNPKAVSKFDGKVYLEVYIPLGVKIAKDKPATAENGDSSNPNTHPQESHEAE